MGWILKVIHHLPAQKIISDVQSLSCRKAIRRADGFPPWRCTFSFFKILDFDRFNKLRAAQISTLRVPAGLTDKPWIIWVFSTWGHIISAGIPHFPKGTERTNVSNPLEKSLGLGAPFSPSLCNDANVLFLISSHKAEMNPQRAAVCFTKSCTTSSGAAHDAFPILQMNLWFLELISSFMDLSRAEASSLTWNNSTNPSKMGFANYIPRWARK